MSDFTWTLVESLPSNNKVYKDLTIYFRQYSYGEVTALSSSLLEQDRFIEIIESGITTHNKFDINDLTFQDFLYIALLRKLATLGADTSYVFETTCLKCGHTVSKTLRPEQFEFVDLEDEFPLTMPVGKKQVTANPMTLLQYKRQKPRGMGILAVELGMTVEELYAQEDIKGVELMDAALYHSVAPIKATCSECGTETEIDPLLIGEDGTNSLVYPFRGPEEPDI